jgi:tetratricopeptide (TPR) repeat protein
MPQQRAFRLQRGWVDGLACPTRPDLARGLGLHFAAQSFSSPYESRAQQIEVEEDALRAFFAAVPRAELDPLSREVWEGLAWLCMEKRLPDFGLVYLEPVAEAHVPWPSLDHAVARSYRELLDPEGALRFLQRALKARPGDPDLLLEAALCAEDIGDIQGAISRLVEARSRAPGRRDLERAYALLLHRTGNPSARPILEGLLEDFPEDMELLQALGLPTGGE